MGHVIGRKFADHDEVISRLPRRSQLRRFIQVPPKYATGARKGTSSFGDSFKEKRGNVKENSQPSWPKKYGSTDIDGRVLPSLRMQRGAPIWAPI
jgi:hypothetical protein